MVDKRTGNHTPSTPVHLSSSTYVAFRHMAEAKGVEVGDMLSQFADEYVKHLHTRAVRNDG